MGYAISWVAIRGKSPDAICEELGLTRTGEFDAVPDFPIVGAELPGGWYLIWGNSMTFTGELMLDEISADAEAIEFFAEEHVMAFGAKAWKNGEEIWSVEHFSDRGMTHLDAQGDLPAEFAEIRDRLLKEQADAGGERAKVDHVSEIPVELARAITGFAYDQGVPGTTDDDDPYEVLEAAEGTPLAKWKPGRGGCLGVIVVLSLMVIGGPVLLMIFVFAASALFRWLFPPG